MMFLKVFITNLFLGFVCCVGLRGHAPCSLSSGFGVRSAGGRRAGASWRLSGAPAVAAAPPQAVNANIATAIKAAKTFLLI